MLGVTNEDNLDWNLIRKGDWWGGSYALKKKKKKAWQQAESWEYNKEACRNGVHRLL